METLTATSSTAIAALRSRVDKVLGRRNAIAVRLSEVRTEIRALEAEEELLDLVGGLFRTLIDTEVTENVQAVGRLLTEGLQAVYEDMDLAVRANVEVQRGKVTVDLVTVQRQLDGTLTEGGSMDAYGGSVTTMESILMRIIVVLRRGMRPILLLDESLGAIQDHYVPNVGRFLALLCDRMGMDVLAITHNQAMVEAAPKAYRIRKAHGVATFREVR